VLNLHTAIQFSCNCELLLLLWLY